MDVAKEKEVPLGVAVGLPPTAHFGEFQAALHHHHIAECSAPCSVQIPASFKAKCSDQQAHLVRDEDATPAVCRDAVPGDECWHRIEKKIEASDWRLAWNLSEVQEAVHRKEPDVCSLPCGGPLSKTSSAVIESSRETIDDPDGMLMLMQHHLQVFYPELGLAIVMVLAVVGWQYFLRKAFVRRQTIREDSELELNGDDSEEALMPLIETSE